MADTHTEDDVVASALARAGLDPAAVEQVVGDERIELTPYDFRRPWMRAFVAVLARTGDVSYACRSAQINRRHAYEMRTLDQDFAAAWQEALAVSVDVLEAVALRRATSGEEAVTVTETERTLPDGTRETSRVVKTEQRRSDTLLMFLLKARRPEDFRERIDHRHSGGDAPIRVEVYRQPDPDRVLELARLMVAETEHPDVEGTATHVNGAATSELEP